MTGYQRREVPGTMEEDGGQRQDKTAGGVDEGWEGKGSRRREESVSARLWEEEIRRRKKNWGGGGGEGEG